MPEKAKVRTRAMVAGDTVAFGLVQYGERNGKAGPGRNARRAYLTPMRAVLILAALLTSGLACTVQAAPRRIALGPPASEVAFRAYGMGLLPIDATFSRFEGSLTYDPDDRAACQVELRVQVASLATDDQSMRSTIIGPDFMNAASFPSLVYTGTCQREELGGMLAMHGVTRPFALALDWQAGRVVAEGRLVRAEWGMTAMPLMGGRTVRIRVTVPLDSSREQGSHPRSAP
jgi:polyisoprenoid-binding protein YceI